MKSTTPAHIAQAAAARSKRSSGLVGLMTDLVLMPVAIVALRLRAHRRDRYANSPR